MFKANLSNEEQEIYLRLKTLFDRETAAKKLYEHLLDLWDANDPLFAYIPEDADIDDYIDDLTNDTELLDIIAVARRRAEDSMDTPFYMWENTWSAVRAEIEQRLDALIPDMARELVKARKQIARLERLLAEKPSKPNFDFVWDDNSVEDIRKAINNIQLGTYEDERFFVTGARLGELRFELLLTECSWGEDDRWEFSFDCYVGGEEGYATSTKDPGYPYDQLDGWLCYREINKDESLAKYDAAEIATIKADAEGEFIQFILHDGYNGDDYLFDKSQLALHIF